MAVWLLAYLFFFDFGVATIHTYKGAAALSGPAFGTHAWHGKASRRTRREINFRLLFSRSILRLTAAAASLVCCSDEQIARTMLRL